jgi:hypothetical protein
MKLLGLSLGYLPPKTLLVSGIEIAIMIMSSTGLQTSRV